MFIWIWAVATDGIIEKSGAWPKIFGLKLEKVWKIFGLKLEKVWKIFGLKLEKY